MPGTPSPETISTKLERIATLARHRPALVRTSLAHHIDVAFLHDAYRRTRKDGAAGVDGQTAEAYAANLEANLQGLLDRLTAGTYKAPPVRRIRPCRISGKRSPRCTGAGSSKPTSKASSTPRTTDTCARCSTSGCGTASCAE